MDISSEILSSYNTDLLTAETTESKDMVKVSRGEFLDKGVQKLGECLSILSWGARNSTKWTRSVRLALVKCLDELQTTRIKLSYAILKMAQRSVTIQH